MNRLMITTAFVLTALLSCGQVSASTVHFSDGFESADGHPASGSSVSIVPNNGWTNHSGQEPVVLNGGASTFSDNYACGTQPCLTGGSGSSEVRNDAGIAGGMNSNRTYTLTWDWEVAIGDSHSGDFGAVSFNGMRSSIVYQAAHGRFNISDPGDSDEAVSIPATQKTYSMKIVHSPTASQYFIDDVLKFGGPPAFSGVGLRLNNDGGGHYDNFLLTSTPEPGSLVLLAVGGLALMTRRRRR